MMTATAKDQRFWDKIAEKYSKQPISDQETYEKKLALTRKYFTPESEVFEFGCGTGSTAILHAPHVKHILATDVADNMLAVGRERAAEAGVTNVTFEHTDIESFDPQGRQFDTVLGLNIIHLCRDPLAVMQKVHSLLKPGGHFIQSTVCLKDAMPIAPFIIPFLQLIGKAPHVKFMKRADLDAMIEEAGFEVEERFRPEKKLSAEFIVARKR
ncbi:MAG: class I SAM-dependent methyltransferase [Henriciella sp.]|uniref:class I SAM-dependent methyltransferase n=1 Tax=Henriciella sp. TaxID=1968823 RepID=UPI0032EA9946